MKSNEWKKKVENYNTCHVSKFLIISHKKYDYLKNVSSDLLEL